MASRNILDLHPALQEKCRDFIFNCASKGLDVIPICTYRSNEEQTLLYAQGRTTPGPIVTNLQAGQSKHNALNHDGKPASRAFDAVPVVNGKLDWAISGSDGEHWTLMGEAARALGLEWGGDWHGHLRDLDHFQLPNSVT